MNLRDDEQAMLSGEAGEAVRWALRYQVEVGKFFGAKELVSVRSAHVMCDGEAAGESGVRFLEKLAEEGAKVAVPTTTDPRSVDFACARGLGQEEWIIEREHRIMRAMGALGAQLSNTCINYQTVDVPKFGEHLGWGDTGTVIFANSVAGARSNFEGGPAGLSAALTGRVASYGFHLPEHRRGTVSVELRARLGQLSDWGALGCVIGRAFPGYWEVPVIEGDVGQPSEDALKHLGAALASYGSHAMFHLVGVTPEAPDRQSAFGDREPHSAMMVGDEDIRDAYGSFEAERDAPDLVVFGTPQLSFDELSELARAFEGRQLKGKVLLTTSPLVKAAADEHGHTKNLLASGATVLQGVCFYLMTARELARTQGHRTILTNSAKLANIIEGYGYNPVFRSTDICIDAAIRGKLEDVRGG